MPPFSPSSEIAHLLRLFSVKSHNDVHRLPHKLYKIQAIRRIQYSDTAKWEMCYILQDIQKRHQNIHMLCTIYSISQARLHTLYALARRALVLLFTCYYHPNHPMLALFSACRALEQNALALFQHANAIPIRQKLMLRDIADEFVWIQNDLDAVAGLIFLQKYSIIEN